MVLLWINYADILSHLRLLFNKNEQLNLICGYAILVAKRRKVGEKMKQTKFSINLMLIIVIIFSAIYFFATVKLVSAVSYRVPINEFFRIEGTDYAIKYSSMDPSGIYKGDENTGSLVLEGDFGFDWGLAVEGDTLYVNEVVSTDLGMIINQLDKINLETMEKQVMLENAILRGRCASGELVCIVNYTVPSNHPETNPLCTFYDLSNNFSRSEDSSAKVIFINPKTSETVYTTENIENEKLFESIYLKQTLQEVMG